MFIFLVFTLFWGSLAALAPEEIYLDSKCYTGGYLSQKKPYGEIGIFLPLKESGISAGFIDVKAVVGADANGFSAGTGYRILNGGAGVLGINAYCDYSNRGRANFKQVGFGLEYSFEPFSFCFNSYCPVGTKKQTLKSCFFDYAPRPYFASRKQLAIAYTGFESMLNLRLWQKSGFAFHASFGPYYYFRGGHHHSVGGSCGLGFSFYSLFSAEILASHDKIYATTVQGIFRFTIPLDFFSHGLPNRTPLEQPVRRRSAILTDSCCNWKWNW